jgi:hypothetical protein
MPSRPHDYRTRPSLAPHKDHTKAQWELQKNRTITSPEPHWNLTKAHQSPLGRHLNLTGSRLNLTKTSLEYHQNLNWNRTDENLIETSPEQY